MSNELFAFYAIIRGVMGVVAVLGLMLYFMDAFSKYKYLKVRGYEKSFLAFVPFVNIWVTVDATYGKIEKINVFGWKAPAIIMKLWGVLFYALTVAVSGIPVVGRILGLLLLAMNVAVLSLIYSDMMERMDEPQEKGAAILAVIINFVASYKVIKAAGKFKDGEKNYREDVNNLRSQESQDGPLSFVNEKM